MSIISELQNYSNFVKNEDCSLMWINPENNYQVNIFECISGEYELSNDIWTIYLDSRPDDNDLLSIMEYMTEAELRIHLGKIEWIIEWS